MRWSSEISLTFFVLLFLTLGCQSNTKGANASSTRTVQLSAQEDLEASLSPSPFISPQVSPGPNSATSTTNTASTTNQESVNPLLGMFSGQTSQVASLPTGESFYAARMQLLEQATKTVDIQALIFKADESGYEIANKLIELKQRGVKIRIIIDAVNNISLKDQQLYYKLHRYGIEVRGYELFYSNFLLSIKNGGNILQKANDLNMRYHEKYFIIDGGDPLKATAIIGGTNISNEYFRADPTKPQMMWRDRDVMLKGPILADVAAAFERNFAEFNAKRLQLGTNLLDTLWTSINKKDYVEKSVNFLDPAVTAHLREIAATPVELAWESCQMTVIQSRPRHQEDLITDAYIRLFDSATTSIDIVNAFFIPDDEIIAALGRAARRNVKIRVVTNHEVALSWIGFGSVMTTAARATYQDVLAFNQEQDAPDLISIFEWGSDPLLHNGEGQNHAKYAVIDGLYSVVGSYNFDPRARHLNSENIGIFASANLAATLTAEIEEYIQPFYSVPVTWEDALSYQQPDTNMGKIKNQILDILTPYL